MSELRNIDLEDKANWVKDEYGLYMCSNCKTRALHEKKYSMDGTSLSVKLSNFCPECGKPMNKSNIFEF